MNLSNYEHFTQYQVKHWALKIKEHERKRIWRHQAENQIEIPNWKLTAEAQIGIKNTNSKRSDIYHAIYKRK
jgi:hypothetical protein